MNEAILARFASYRRQLVESPAIAHYSVMKLRAGSSDGHIRVRAILIDDGLLEFSEYVAVDDENPKAREYSFQWLDAQLQLVRRWDSARHFPNLPYAPHHIHQIDGTVTGNDQEPDLGLVLRAIKQQIL